MPSYFTKDQLLSGQRSWNVENSICEQNKIIITPWFKGYNKNFDIIVFVSPRRIQTYRYMMTFKNKKKYDLWLRSRGDPNRSCCIWVNDSCWDKRIETIFAFVSLLNRKLLTNSCWFGLDAIRLAIRLVSRSTKVTWGHWPRLTSQWPIANPNMLYLPYGR